MSRQVGNFSELSLTQDECRIFASCRDTVRVVEAASEVAAVLFISGWYVYVHMCVFSRLPLPNYLIYCFQEHVQADIAVFKLGARNGRDKRSLLCILCIGLANA